MASVRPLHVLIVDDDDADSLMIEEALEGATVPPITTRVSDGRQALDFLHKRGYFGQAHRPDLVLLDLNMPRMSGHDVLAAVKSDQNLKTIPIVVLTTSNADADIVGSYGRHANAYVTKPMDLESFETVVRLVNQFYREVAALPESE